MKKVIYIIGVCLLVSLSSCEDWLNISPKSEIRDSEFFKTTDGFEKALIGIYIGMTDKDVYGQNLSWHFTEYLAKQYDAEGTKFNSIREYDYTSLTTHNYIWAKQYNIIAEINKLLGSLEEFGDVLDPYEFNIIKGEALALRAYCHFDLLRLFGFGNLANRPSLLEQKTIPYSTKYSKEIVEQKTYSETFEMLESDINNAIELLSDDSFNFNIDQADRPENFPILMENPFLSGLKGGKGREIRLNYVAAHALKARIYLWEGKKTEALKAAEDAIELMNSGISRNVFKWASDLSNVDHIFYDEQLFCLDVKKLDKYLIEDYYSESINGNHNKNRLFQEKSFVEGIFSMQDDIGEGESDLRFQNQHELENHGDDEGYLTIKIRNTDGDKGEYGNNTIPMLKMAECYLIAAECHVDEDNPNMAEGIEKAREYINLLKLKRNIHTNYFLDNTATAEDIKTAIYKEYRKEFIQEGQLFYYYKRRGLVTFPGLKDIEMDDSKYVLPLPDLEVELGYRDQDVE